MKVTRSLGCRVVGPVKGHSNPGDTGLPDRGTRYHCCVENPSPLRKGVTLPRFPAHHLVGMHPAKSVVSLVDLKSVIEKQRDTGLQNTRIVAGLVKPRLNLALLQRDRIEECLSTRQRHTPAEGGKHTPEAHRQDRAHDVSLRQKRVAW